MIEIKDLLRKFDHLLLSGELKKETVRGIISKVIGVPIKSDDIDIRGGNIFLNIKPIYKNEILIKKEKIDSLLEETLGQKKTREAREIR